MTRIDLKAEGRRLEREAADAADKELARVLQRRPLIAPTIVRGRPAVFDFGLVASGECRTITYESQRVQRFGGPALEVWHHGPLRCFTVVQIVFGDEIWNVQPIPAVMLRAVYQAARGPSLSVHVPLRITVRNDDKRPRRLVLALEPLELQ